MKVIPKENLTYNWKHFIHMFVSYGSSFKSTKHYWWLSNEFFWLRKKKYTKLHQCNKSRAVKSCFSGWTEAWSSQRAPRCSTCVSQCFLFVALSMLLCKLPAGESHAWTQQLPHTIFFFLKDTLSCTQETNGEFQIFKPRQACSTHAHGFSQKPEAHCGTLTQLCVCLAAQLSQACMDFPTASTQVHKVRL